jgi:hypothetical protein
VVIETLTGGRTDPSLELAPRPDESPVGLGQGIQSHHFLIDGAIRGNNVPRNSLLLIPDLRIA